jgi:hypothetical protein
MVHGYNTQQECIEKKLAILYNQCPWDTAKAFNQQCGIPPEKKKSTKSNIKTQQRWGSMYDDRRDGKLRVSS